jgi:hypothetical protein
MPALQNCDLLSRDTHAMDQLHDFLRQRREAHEPVAELEVLSQFSFEAICGMLSLHASGA